MRAKRGTEASNRLLGDGSVGQLGPSTPACARCASVMLNTTSTWMNWGLGYVGYMCVNV